MLSPTIDDPIQLTIGCSADKRRDPDSSNRRHQRSRGQSFVEFALLLPALVLILALAADFGRALTAYIAISGAAREGAAFGMQSTIQAIDSGGIEAAALAEANDPWGTAPTVNSQVGIEPLETGGYPYVEVTVSYTFSTLIPIPPIPSTIDMQRQVRMRVIS